MTTSPGKNFEFGAESSFENITDVQIQNLPSLKLSKMYSKNLHQNFVNLKEEYDRRKYARAVDLAEQWKL